jgi:hypothetical protein
VPGCTHSLTCTSRHSLDYHLYRIVLPCRPVQLPRFQYQQLLQALSPKSYKHHTRTPRHTVPGVPSHSTSCWQHTTGAAAYAQAQGCAAAAFAQALHRVIQGGHAPSASGHQGTHKGRAIIAGYDGQHAIHANTQMAAGRACVCACVCTTKWACRLRRPVFAPQVTQCGLAKELASPAGNTPIPLMQSPPCFAVC